MIYVAEQQIIALSAWYWTSTDVEIHFPNSTIDVVEGQQLVLCVILESTFGGGIASPLTATISNNIASGTSCSSHCHGIIIVLSHQGPLIS